MRFNRSSSSAVTALAASTGNPVTWAAAFQVRKAIGLRGIEQAIGSARQVPQRISEHLCFWQGLVIYLLSVRWERGSVLRAVATPIVRCGLTDSSFPRKRHLSSVLAQSRHRYRNVQACGSSPHSAFTSIRWERATGAVPLAACGPKHIPEHAIGDVRQNRRNGFHKIGSGFFI